MKQVFIIVLFLSALVLPAKAQQDPLRELQNGGSSGDVQIEVDSLLQANYYKLLAQSKKKPGVPGYRIRIFSESGLGAKDKQRQVKGRFLSLFPGVDAYSIYDAPFFKVYVGDCRTRTEALKLFDQVKKEFRNPIIVEDRINLKKED